MVIGHSDRCENWVSQSLSRAAVSSRHRLNSHTISLATLLNLDSYSDRIDLNELWNSITHRAGHGIMNIQPDSGYDISFVLPNADIVSSPLYKLNEE